MTGIYTKILSFAALILLVGFFFATETNAATLSNVSDQVTTSRPSASAPIITQNIAANDTQTTVVDNGSIYLASDSAVIYRDTGETTNAGLNIASMSAQFSSSPFKRNIYFTSAVPNTHHIGNAVIVNVTATHIIKFNVNTAVPSGGKIVITFPGTGSNIASPSASTFSFNNLGSGSVICNPTTACSGGTSISAPSITLTTAAAYSTGQLVVIAIGCTGTVSTAGICTTYAPALINPTKTNSAGTNDQWKVSIKTQDSSSLDLDTSKAIVATIEAVQVQATVEPYITFTIAGLANGASACSDTTNPGSGLDATSTFVNLGSLSTVINISAQSLVVSTNAAAGYSITATSSGKFINPSSGFFLPDANIGNGLTAVDTPAPGFLTAGTSAFGIHPCAAGSTSIPTVNTTTWGSGTTGGGAGAKYSNPYNTGVNGYYANISSFASPASNSTTTVEYAATASLTTPAGTYTNYFTYVATPNF
jgi:hypothetical protein